MPNEFIKLPSATGTKKKAPILFVHGSYCSAAIWRHRFMPFFAEQGHDCYAVSFRGHGKTRSDWPLHFYSLDDYANDVAWATERIDEPPIIVGHSLGGMVVQKYIEENSCAGVILLNSLPPSGAMSTIVHMMTMNPEIYWTLSTAMMFNPEIMPFDVLKRMLVSADTHPASLAEVHGLFQAESLRALNDVTYLDIPRRPAVEGFPIAVMGGDADVMIPVSALRETAEFHDAYLEVISGAPHAVMLDRRWKHVAQRMSDWMTTAL